ncbi:MAG: hypothetical protein VX246_11230 [Myxococcota bacterium]|nr:hypothetical protein [Myxococcota bacterium]
MADSQRATLWIVLASLVALGAAFYLQLRDSAVSASRPALLNFGYAVQVRALVEAGETERAQAELDRATLLTPAALDLIGTMPRSTTFEPTRRLDTSLRKLIANKWLLEFKEEQRLDNAGRAMIKLAMSNAETLLLLAPRDAKAHYVSGSLYLMRGFDSKAPIDFMKAESHLTRALRLDPTLQQATEMLAITKQRAAQR